MRKPQVIHNRSGNARPLHRSGMRFVAECSRRNRRKGSPRVRAPTSEPAFQRQCPALARGLRCLGKRFLIASLPIRQVVGRVELLVRSGAADAVTALVQRFVAQRLPPRVVQIVGNEQFVAFDAFG